MKTTTAPSMRIFVNPSGQRDNLGDSVLRRAYLDALRGMGELHVYVGTDDAYSSGLGLQPGDIGYSARSRWLLEALSSSKSRMAFALNAGEWVLDRRFTVNVLWQGALVLAAKSRAGYSVALGISIRRGAPVTGRRILRILLRGIDQVGWRDAEGRSSTGRGFVMPDWAFALGASASQTRSTASRDLIAVALRGDRPFPGRTWIETVRRVAADHDASIVVVNQMKRDEARCKALAESLGGTVLEWNDQSHLDHEVAVRRVYRDSIAVFSDRIHALIIGLSEGAVPIGLTTDTPEKILRTFAPVTAVPVGASEHELVDIESALSFARNVLEHRDQLLDDLDASRNSLVTLVHSLRSATIEELS